jgi:hypothetical protein
MDLESIVFGCAMCADPERLGIAIEVLAFDKLGGLPIVLENESTTLGMIFSTSTSRTMPLISPLFLWCRRGYFLII